MSLPKSVFHVCERQVGGSAARLSAQPVGAGERAAPAARAPCFGLAQPPDTAARALTCAAASSRPSVTKWAQARCARVACQRVGTPAAGDSSAVLGSAQPSADSKLSTAAAAGNGAEPVGDAGSPGSARLPGPAGLPGPTVRSMLLCGADVVASFGAPGVWREDLLRGILSNHGVVCIARCLICS